MKHLKKLREHFSHYPAFTMRDVKTFFSGKGLSAGYAQLLMHNLEKKGEITRISNGNYTFWKDSLSAGFAFQPFYYGLQEALSLRGLWEQETNPIIITTRRVRSGLRTFGGNNFQIRRISRKMFFGFEPIRYYDNWLPVSTPEKTLVDFAYFKQKMPKDALEEIAEKIDEKKLRQMLQKTPEALAKKVLKTLLQVKKPTRT